MSITRDQLLAAIRLRYDHASAEMVLDAALDRAGLAQASSYRPTDAPALGAALSKVGDRLGQVTAALDVLFGPVPPHVVETKPEPKVEAKPEPKKPEPSPSKIEGPKGTVVHLTGVEAKKGEVVLMCGAFPALGDWNPENAREMTLQKDAWTATIELPADAEVAFKFLRRTTDGDLVWEPGENRTLVAKPRLEVTWR